MNAQFLSATATVDEAAIQPLPNSPQVCRLALTADGWARGVSFS